MKTEHVAHVKQDADGNWHQHALNDHLQKVGDLSSEFSCVFKSDKWSKIAGYWHDLGKISPALSRATFAINLDMSVRMLISKRMIGPAIRLQGRFMPLSNLVHCMGHIIAYLIAGHHAGLADWIGGKGGLSHRLLSADSLDEYKESIGASVELNLLHSDKPDLPGFIDSADKFSLWLRMLFSCLVDADFLDTEQFMNPDKASRRGGWASIAELQRRFDEEMKALLTNSESTPLAKLRKSILETVSGSIQNKQPGIFSLTVPTGGGKTLSSLAFALQHAQTYNKRRIIYAIPFTSIIEQNADVFRTFLGEDDAVLEHHSSLDVSDEKENSQRRLAAENWDAPVVINHECATFRISFMLLEPVVAESFTILLIASLSWMKLSRYPATFMHQ